MYGTRITYFVLHGSAPGGAASKLTCERRRHATRGCARRTGTSRRRTERQGRAARRCARRSTTSRRRTCRTRRARCPRPAASARPRPASRACATRRSTRACARPARPAVPAPHLPSAKSAPLLMLRRVQAAEAARLTALVIRAAPDARPWSRPGRACRHPRSGAPVPGALIGSGQGLTRGTRARAGRHLVLRLVRAGEHAGVALHPARDPDRPHWQRERHHLPGARLRRVG